MPYQITAAQQLPRLPKVQQWYRSLEATTGVAPDDYLRGLHRFSARTDTHPQELLEMSDGARESLIDRFRTEEAALRWDSRRIVAAVRSWIGFGKNR